MYRTQFGAIDDFRKGGVTVIDDDPKNFVFSNVFEVAATSAPYERIAVAKNFQYVVEAVCAEGPSPWYAAAHDEFALAMDGEIEIRLVKLAAPETVVDPASEGGHRLAGEPEGRAMGRIVLRRGHMALLPAGAAYRFDAPRASTMIIQTIAGPETVERWADICQT